MHRRSPIRPLLLLAILLLPACGDKGGSTPKTTKDAPPKSDQPPIQVTAVELVGQMRKDGKGTQAKYKARTIEVSGGVLRTTPNYLGSGSPAVFLLGVAPPKGKGKGKNVELGPDGLKQNYNPEAELVRCTFPREQALAVLSLVTGQQVTIRGKYIGVTAAQVSDAELVTKGEIPVKEYTLADLRKVLPKEDLGVLTPATPPLILSGTLKSVEADKPMPGNYTLTAEDPAEPKLSVRIVVPLSDAPSAFADHVKGLKAGDAFRAYGQVRRSKDDWSLVGTRQFTLLLPQR